MSLMAFANQRIRETLQEAQRKEGLIVDWRETQTILRALHRLSQKEGDWNYRFSGTRVSIHDRLIMEEPKWFREAFPPLQLPINPLTGKLKKPWEFATPTDSGDNPEISPAPSLLNIGIQWGIYASGPKENLHKEIHFRYRFHGIIWNPYSFALKLTEETGSKWKIHLRHLPGVEITNLSIGKSLRHETLDTLENYANGSMGIHAWVDLPDELPPGSFYQFTTPSPKSQPQGLERLLSRRFPLGQSHGVRVQFSNSTSQSEWTLFPYDRIEDPLSRPYQSTLSWGSLTYARADQSTMPFWIGPVSSQFRFKQPHSINQFSVDYYSMLLSAERDEPSTIPLKRVESAHSQFPTEGKFLNTTHILFEKPPQQISTAEAVRAYANPSANTLLGHPNAREINQLLDHYQFARSYAEAYKKWDNDPAELTEELFIGNPIHLQNSKSVDWMNNLPAHPPQKLLSTTPDQRLRSESANAWKEWISHWLSKPESTRQTIQSMTDLLAQRKTDPPTPSVIHEQLNQIRFDDSELHENDFWVAITDQIKFRGDAIRVEFHKHPSQKSSSHLFQRIPTFPGSNEYDWVHIQSAN